jgi:hypothetical protein
LRVTFAPAYATVAPAVGVRVMAAQAALVTALAELGAMTGDRLRLDPATVVDPVANALPEVEVEEPGLGRRRHAHWWAAALPHSPPNHPARLNRHRERNALPGR